MKLGREIELRYLRHGEEMPEGWRLSNDMAGSHHGYYARLIEREVPRGEEVIFSDKKEAPREGR